MASEIGNTEADVLIPERWRPKMLKAHYARMTIGKRVLSVDGDVEEYGDILHIPIEPSVSVNNVGATGTTTNQALTPTEQQLTVDKWKECTIEIVDKAKRQSIVELLTAFTPAFGKAMAAQYDADLAALQSDVTTNVVGSTADPEPVNPDMLTAAIQKLLDLDIEVDDPENISFCFHTSQWSVLKKIPVFNDANLTGSKTGGALTVKIPDIYGIPTYFTTKIVSSATNGISTRRNLLFMREAFAWGRQKNFNIEQFARTKKATPISGDALYGVKTVRENHAVLLHTAP